MLPGSRPDYRTTAGAFKWIVLIVIVGSILFVRVFKKAIRETNEIYREAGYGEGLLIDLTNQPARQKQ